MLNYKNQKISQKKLDREQIRQFYLEGAKSQEDFKFGLEYERISLDLTTLKSAKYEHIEKIIKNFAHIKGWGILYDGKTVIGAMGEGSSISLEPGCQFELSLEPKAELSEIKNSARDILSLLDRIAKFYNIKFLEYGITPNSVYKDIEIVHKERYEIMAQYLPTKGKFAPVMMRESAGVQLNVDYADESDAISKIKFLSYISPVLTGFFANSPIRNNKLTNYKSFRALAWKYTGSDRCAVFYKNLINKPNSTFDDYIDSILDVPMLFIERDGAKIPFRGKITFREYMSDYDARIEDYILHSSLCFPDVRLKKCIEIRNHDCQNFDMTMCICALYKGLLNSDFNEILRDFEDMDADDIGDMGYLAAKYGVDFHYKNIDAKNYIKKLFTIAEKNLNDDEKKYLEPAGEYLEQGICVADKIIKNKISDAKALTAYLGA